MKHKFFDTEGIVLKKLPYNETHLTIHVFSPDRGKIYCLYRISKKSTSIQPDIFDHATLYLNIASKSNHLYIKEYHPIHRLRDIAKNINAFTYASQWLNILSDNLKYIDSFEKIYPLTLKALKSWESNELSDVIYLKCLYKLASSEGYPVIQHWLKSLPDSLRNIAELTIRNPLNSQSPKNDSILKLINSIQDWLIHHTPIYLTTPHESLLKN